jgi:hypothetical protein
MGSTWSGTSGACSGCVADLRSGSPATIQISPAMFMGRYCDTTPLQVTTSGQLTMLATVTWGDVFEINQDFGDHHAPPAFATQGSDRTATVDGTLVEPAADTASCVERRIVTPYHVDWYVNQQNLRLRGLRNFRIDAATTACRPPV